MEGSTITLNNTGKRFNFDWIFRNIQYSFHSSHQYAITGPNGSGKSTLMQILAGCISSSAGAMEIKVNQQTVEAENIFRHIAFAAPYTDLPEELSGAEMLSFQHKFKSFIDDLSAEEILEYSGLISAKNKAIRYFSSGMKQRLKLILAMLSHVPIILLDEPTTNLDEAGVLWYADLIQNYSRNRILIIASNQERDYHFCEMKLSLMNYK